MGKPAPEVSAANLSPINIPWTDPAKMNAEYGEELEKPFAGGPFDDVEELDQHVTFRGGY